jgi:putative salt-induced outer membrane protein YdiY
MNLPGVARVLVVLLLAGAGVCRADQVVLDNGDRLTGTIKSLAAGKLVIDTKYAGAVSIDVQHVASVETESEMTVVLEDDTRLYGRLSGNAHSLELPGAEKAVDLTRVSNVESGHVSGREWNFSGRFALGASSSNGNSDTRNLHFDTEGVARQGRNRYTLGGRGNYANSNDEDTDNNTVIYGQYDRFLTKKVYAYANTSFENNRFTDIYLRTTLGAGVGYQWLDTERTKLALEGGLSYVYTNYYSQPTQQFPAARLATKIDHWLWQNALQFFNYNEFYPSLEDFNNSFLRSQLGFRFPIVHKFQGVAQLNLDWNGNPPPGKVELDSTVILSLGYAW